MDFTLRNMYTFIMNWEWLRGYDNGDFEDGDNADNFMGPLGILLYQMRYSGRCSVFYIELLLEDIDWEGGQNSNHIMVGFPTSGWVSNQWLEIHPWWVNFQPFTLVGLDAVVPQVWIPAGQPHARPCQQPCLADVGLTLNSTCNLPLINPIINGNC